MNVFRTLCRGATVLAVALLMLSFAIGAMAAHNDYSETSTDFASIGLDVDIGGVDTNILSDHNYAILDVGLTNANTFSAGFCGHVPCGIGTADPFNSGSKAHLTNSMTNADNGTYASNTNGIAATARSRT